MCFAWANADEIIIDLSGMILTESMTYVHELRITLEYNLIRDVYFKLTTILQSSIFTFSIEIIIDTYVFNTSFVDHLYRRLPFSYIYF